MNKLSISRIFNELTQTNIAAKEFCGGKFKKTFTFKLRYIYLGREKFSSFSNTYNDLLRASFFFADEIKCYRFMWIFSIYSEFRTKIPKLDI